MIALIEAECVEKRKWLSHEEFMDLTIIAESTPGPIGVNMATYCGITTAGFSGGVVATFGLILPSFLIILIISKLLGKFQQNPYVQSAMSLLRPTSVGLIGAAFYSVVKVALLHTEAMSTGGFAAIFRWPAIILCVVLALISWKFKKLHPIVLIVIGAAAGILFQL